MMCIIDESTNVTANITLYLSTVESGPFPRQWKMYSLSTTAHQIVAVVTEEKVYFLRAEFKEWVVIYQVSFI